MAKSPRKGDSVGHKSASVSHKLNPKSYKPPKVGGKNFKSYNIKRPNRRLSIAESTSSDSSDGIATKTNLARKTSMSDSESSLTAMSEEDESAVSRKGSVFFNSSPRGAKSYKAKLQKRGKTTKSIKRGAGKSTYKSYPRDFASDEDDDVSMDDEAQEVMDYHFGDDDEEEDATGLAGIYSMLGNVDSGSASDSDSDSNESDDDNDSSSDDEGVDFVRLQAERRAKAMKNLKAIKGLPPKNQKRDPEPKNKAAKRRRSSAYRRRSEVALPEDINFKFEFNDVNNSAVIDEEDEEFIGDGPSTVNNSIILPAANAEEDIGEEVAMDSNMADDLDFHFDEPLLDVPKFKDEELNSEDDYDYDDNDLLATLQADNDLDEFINNKAESVANRTRQGSLSSVNEDNEDLFLREEEKYLVNEFEINGFDDDDVENAPKETAKVMDSFQDSSQKKQVFQYASSSDGSENGSDNEDSKRLNTFDDDDDDDQIDIIDFDSPFFETNSDGDKSALAVQTSDKPKSPTKKKSHFPKQKNKRKGPLDSDEEDDSYLWNYFFSTDAESNSESEGEVDIEEQFVLEEIFKRDSGEKQSDNSQEDLCFDAAESENEYDSGESTDVEESLPSPAIGNKLGSKLAKEVLSSKTADYRPPVLGTWIAIDSKPFGIIDGLSTRTLNSNVSTRNPRTKGWRNFSLKNDSEDLAIELDELLNISELDNDDENDVRIWKDFNNNKKRIPLGAFRNKTLLHQPVVVPEPMSGYGVSKMNTEYGKRKGNAPARPVAKAPGGVSKEYNIPSKVKRRRASIADAVSGGFRPTMSGLFSESVLADVEEVLGEDKDIMALIKGL